MRRFDICWGEELRGGAAWKRWALPGVCVLVACTSACDCDAPRFEPHAVTATLEGTGGQTSAATTSSAAPSSGVRFWIYSRCEEAFLGVGPAHANPSKGIAVDEIDFFHLDKGDGMRTTAPEGSRIWLLETKSRVIARARVTKELATVSAVGKPKCESLVVKLGAAR